MKKSFYILLALMVCVSSAAAQKKSTKEREGLKGPVQSVRIESYVLSETSGKEEPRYGAIVYRYDKAGYKTEEYHLSTDGTLSRQIFFTYDANNWIAEEADYLGSGSLREKTLYTYDNDNKTAEAAVYRSDGTFSYKVVFKFDLGYDLSKLEGLQGVYRFFRESVWMEAAQYDSGGTLLRRFTAVDKDSGRELTLQILNNSSEDQRSNAAKLIYIYNRNGNLTDRYLIVKDTRIDIGKDDDNVKLKRTPKYSYDSEGNWTKKDFFSMGKTQVEYRTITYY